MWVHLSNINAINSNFVLGIGSGNKCCPYCLKIFYHGPFVKI